MRDDTLAELGIHSTTVDHRIASDPPPAAHVCVLPICSMRDDTLAELGIRLEDKPDGSSVWKPEDPAVRPARHQPAGFRAVSASVLLCWTVQQCADARGPGGEARLRAWLPALLRACAPWRRRVCPGQWRGTRAPAPCEERPRLLRPAALPCTLAWRRADSSTSAPAWPRCLQVLRAEQEERRRAAAEARAKKLRSQLDTKSKVGQEGAGVSRPRCMQPAGRPAHGALLARIAPPGHAN